ncbi:hypothetical protein G7B40_002995 [Aetokthonos hydrillicola Thurmond2011]|jgi:hypothetical protein|uniref:Uncharacterized protein n=1 Tax=Aetokthonos hydrillicola Thurmond2011 TaxID=2712845 RepID=A0AAP5M7C1_9CYAN|nr:effector-associated domain EAD1-containing protein [Aetokthonos hydrillicola]MBO3459358.1 hypothetical protein [Aetokthonos hydrillicola CCALA 1050]MBW4586504.1 hypothetical protein [Aetokthonos hydrillicola CCALA 1050]MDR9893552.1 hypothetical protein [Aetokthonos hydrillicola Thurmond2011]
MGKFELNGTEKKLLVEGLCKALGNEYKFEEFVTYELDKNINEIKRPNTTLNMIALDLVNDANNKEYVQDLMSKAHEYVPGNQTLKFAYTAITLKHILKSYEPQYLSQMQQSYSLICCSKKNSKTSDNEHSKHSFPETLEKIFDELFKLEQLDRLSEFFSDFYQKLKNTNFTEIKELEKIIQIFPDLLIQRENNHNKSKLDADAREVYKHLLNLDFWEQVKSFRKFVDEYSVGVCIIHGEQGYGQEWLLNRLVLLITQYQQVNKIPIDINIKTYSYNTSNIIERVWHKLGEKYGIKDKDMIKGEQKAEKIIEAMCNNLKYESVIIIIKEVNKHLQDEIKKLIEQIWKPLTKKVCNSYSCSHQHKLLLFVVDLEGSVEQWNIPHDNFYENNYEPHLILKLPKIQKISCNILKEWVNHKIDDLPKKLRDRIDNDKNVDEILAKECHGGVPLSVLQYICKEWGYDWYHLEGLWLNNN